MRALIIELPGLHLGYLGCYGNEWIETPHLDRFAAEGVVFDHHIPSCLGVQRAAWTGRFQLPLLPGEELRTKEAQPDLPALLAAHGIQLREGSCSLDPASFLEVLPLLEDETPCLLWLNGPRLD